MSRLKKRSTLLLAVAAALALPVLAGAQIPRPAAVEVDMGEFTFRPSVIRLQAGRPAALILRNRGQIAHQLETDYLRTVAIRLVSAVLDVEMPGVDVVRLEPGGSARLEFLPRQKGRFAFACTIEGHREAGMHGVLEVR
ncbi:MAG: cupredoxin domain-containing protein [Armatimonadota bacterium]|nr:cupredoxin domain-containing protein [Armatimonadota bacterium]